MLQRHCKETLNKDIDTPTSNSDVETLIDYLKLTFLRYVLHLFHCIL